MFDSSRRVSFPSNVTSSPSSPMPSSVDPTTTLLEVEDDDGGCWRKGSAVVDIYWACAQNEKFMDGLDMFIEKKSTVIWIISLGTIFCFTKMEFLFHNALAAFKVQIKSIPVLGLGICTSSISAITEFLDLYFVSLV
ncbi:uncharacterized protein [Elaeis guineensis]|uniref:uncharacterized protein n=1 Tax=Elaeis guineensis var. tenera TaxID=51953 RepID=UPI003C6D7FDB